MRVAAQSAKCVTTPAPCRASSPVSAVPSGFASDQLGMITGQIQIK
jgi:hypothetical protein